MKAIEYNITSVKCDAPGCDHREDDVSPEELEKWLDVPCPKCGAPLLTKEDLATTKFLIGMADVINTLLPGDYSEENALHLRTEMNGSGEVNFKEVSKEDYAKD